MGNQEFGSWIWKGIELGPEKWEMGTKSEFSSLKVRPLLMPCPSSSVLLLPTSDFLVQFSRKALRIVFQKVPSSLLSILPLRSPNLSDKNQAPAVCLTERKGGGARGGTGFEI